MMRKKSIRRETTHNGTLSTPVSFFQMKVADDFYDHDVTKELVFKAWAEVYNPSLKDLEIMKSKGIKKALTMKIRDPLTDYQPQNTHTVQLNDVRFEGQEWEIVDIRPDFYNRDYMIILLKGN